MLETRRTLANAQMKIHAEGGRADQVVCWNFCERWHTRAKQGRSIFPRGPKCPTDRNVFW